MTVGVDPDQELEVVIGRGGVGHRERAGLGRAGDGDVHVLPRVERQLRRVLQGQNETAQVAGQRLDRLHAGLDDLDRHARAEHLLVVVDELHGQVAVGMRAAEEDISLLQLVIGQGKGRVALHVDVAVEEEGLARGALPLLAAVHQHHALPECGIEDGFVLVGLDLDPDRFEAHRVLGSHLKLFPCP